MSDDLEPRIEGDGVVVRWVESKERYFAFVEFNGLDCDVFLSLLAGTDYPYITANHSTWTVYSDEPRQFTLDIYFAAFPPTTAQVEDAHRRIVTARQTVLFPTKEQAVDLASHPKEKVRDYARARMAEWHRRWEKEAQDRP
jgi:hypothetical protein